MLRQKPSALLAHAETGSLAASEADYTPHDMVVTVTALPSTGVVLNSDRLTPVALGDTLTVAELTALRLAPKSIHSGEALPWNGFVVHVPQNYGRLPTPVFADLAAGAAPDTSVVITELPSNGSVFLADGMTAVLCGQAITAAQLCGLTFRPATGSVGQISLLCYRGPEEALSGEILFVVGPAVSRSGARETATTGVDNTLSPVAVALLLEAGLESLKATQASAAVGSGDVVSPDSSVSAAATVGMPGQISDRPTEFVPDHIGPASAILANPAPAVAGAAGSTETDTSKLHHHIGSSSPTDFGSLKLAPLAQTTTLMSTSVPSFEIPNNGILEISGPSAKSVTFDTGNGELILDHSAQFHGVIASSSPSTPLSPNDLIDLKDLPFTSSMSATVHYDSALNISTVDFSNGSKTVTLQFSGQDLNWTFKSDGQGGTIVADPPLNKIALENQKQGTPQSVWQIDPGRDSTKLEGFTTAISTNLGGTVQFKIDNLTGNPNYQIQIYRLGYYGGDGARLITTLQHTGSSVIAQPAPITNPATGEVDAGNWSVTDSWTIPTTDVSGVYLANVVQGNQVFQIPFIVKDPSSTSDIVFQTADETWQAYNGWGGADLYGGNGPAPPAVSGLDPGAAYAVSYNRPITTFDSSGAESGPQDTIFGAEYSAIYWLEENGYDVSYISGMDAATNGSLLLNHKIYMDAGHDEYWTDSQVANVKAAAAAGVNLVFMSGNEIFWQTQFAPSIDGSNTANRTLVTYKDSHFQQLTNPTGQGTGSFLAPVSWGGAGMPSNALTGTVFQVDGTDPTAITVPYGQSLLRIWRNTSVANTAPGHTATLASDLLGYEWDSAPDNGFRPVGLVNLSSTTVFYPTAYNTGFGNVDTSGTATHNLVMYRDPTSGALVFGAGTVFWSWGLSNQGISGFGSPTDPDPSVQQAMVNLFADMGVQPQTLQATLAIASQSTDHTPPTSTITNVSTRTPVEGQLVTVTGTAHDAGGVIADVDVSTDGGKTWHPATTSVGAASENWTYTFAAPSPGTYTIQSRAVDDSLNMETPAAGVSYKPSPSTALSLFGSSATPAIANVSDPNAVEVGFKFTSATNGQITGIRFYKGPLNNGAHIVDLWSSTGTLLATATSTGETASGWQQVNFSSPVNIVAGTTYVASYHSSGGEYSDTLYYFDTLQNPTNGSLSAIASGANGVFAYSSGSIFPNNVSVTGDNYWVDVVFNDGIYSPQANNDSGFVGVEHTPLTISASALLANDTDPNGLPLSITGVGNAIDGTVSYNASTQTVTFVPSTAGTASFTYTITDSLGGTSSAGVTVNVNNPPSAQTLFSPSATPTTITESDNSSVELGVKFQALTSGTVTGVRFYKGPLNTGIHSAELWTSTGTLLATATFTNESASGWQQVDFSSAVNITAGTTYVVSYHTNTGNYSADAGYFATEHDSGSLTGLASAASGGNGLYAYGAGPIFPTNSFGAANYWVDVVFQGPPLQPPVAGNDSGFFVGQNSTLTIAASALLANDTDPNGLPLSITGVSNPSHGSVSYNAGTQTVSFVPTAGYTGPASFTYSLSDGRTSTVSANVSLTVTPPPPIANNDSGFVGTEHTPLTISASTLLANDTDPNGSTISILGVSNAIDGTVSYDANTQTITFVPSTAGTASFNYSITDTLGGVATATASVIVNNPPSAQTLFSTSATPTNVTVDDNSSVELGVKFVAARNGTITGIRFYKGPQNTGVHTAELWTSTGTLLATATFNNESASGWQQVDFAAPVSITAGTTYVASYHTNGDYSADNNYFTTVHTSGALTAPTSDASGGNGVFAYGAGTLFPTNTFSAANYWVDVVFEGNALQSPVANNDSGLVATENTTLSISASTLLANDTDPNGMPLSIAGVSNPLHGTVSYDSSTQTVSFVPTSGYSGPASFTYSITDGGGTASANVSLTVAPLPPTANNDSGFATNLNTTDSIAASALLANDTDPNGLPLSITGVSNPTNGTVSYNAGTQTVSFVPTAGYTGAASFRYTVSDGNGTSSATASLLVTDPSTVSLFNPTTAPAIAAVNDPNAIEVGVKFQAAENGQITGLLFYKGVQNTGPHVADLWSSDGTLLATATFSNETPSGWQQVNFSAPVAITAGTTYVASYHTNSGDYAADPSMFANPVTNGLLTAPSSSSSGGNGVFAYGASSLFPTNSFGSTSYGVDVVFKPQLAA